MAFGIGYNFPLISGRTTQYYHLRSDDECSLLIHDRPGNATCGLTLSKRPDKRQKAKCKRQE